MNAVPIPAAIDRLKGVLSLAGWLLVAFLPALSGAIAPPGEWYRTLAKPAWNPPGWVFGPAWTFLYASMGVAAWLVWGRGGLRARRRELGWFMVQWLLNAIWSPLFFGLHQPGWAFAEILLLGASIAITGLYFARAHLVAGLLFLPYLAWVTFAALLNFTLWRMNR